ncbi:hypothetical protein SteCoe_33561 [Stentor coeruleus]|uniref:Uncharacterized protein n=1 Tax=Stentor coeruleus TaxID=5963 RepID=A0A1R2AWF6_9CILI|nr:hypothetical protein SteCoe_33561 [Stentor coeruleus]
MYRFSKSVPRGYEYLSSKYSTRKKHKCDVARELPPAPYYRQEKSYINVSPLRSKQKLIEARTYKSPLSERQKNFTLPQTKLEAFLGNLSHLEEQFKLHNQKIVKKCKENYMKMKSIKRCIDP